MKAELVILCLLILLAGGGRAQELSYDVPSASATNTPSISSDAPALMEFTEGMGTSKGEPVFSDTLRISEPLARPFKAPSILEFPRRLLQMINPFVKGTGTDQPLRVKREAMAWSTLAGWSPGQSAFADDTRHEPQLGLITIRDGSTR